MVLTPKPKPIDSEAKPGIDPIPASKTCRECLVKLPVSHFGIAKQNADGYRHICKACRSQTNAEYWTQKHGRLHPISNEEPIRSIKRQNTAVLATLFAHNHMKSIELRALGIQNRKIYRVHFGPSERIGLLSLALFTEDGSVFMEWALSGVDNPQSAMLAYLRLHGLRLEWSDMDLQNSLSQIYFL